MFFFYDFDATSCQLNLKKHQFHYYKIDWSPTTSLHSPLLTHVHDSRSNELYHSPYMIPSSKTKLLPLDVYVCMYVCMYLFYFPNTLFFFYCTNTVKTSIHMIVTFHNTISVNERFSFKFAFWHLTHTHTNMISNRKICIIALCVFQSFNFFWSWFVRVQGTAFLLTINQKEKQVLDLS